MTLLNCLIAGAALLDPTSTGTEPAGRYVEVRSASVYAGACHYNSEYVTQGREALLAWSFERGSHAGVDLGGLSVAVALGDDENLAAAPARRRSIVFVSDQLDARRQAALLGWLLASHGAQLGEVRGVMPVALAVEVGEAGFRVQAGQHSTLQGDVMPNRECCKMPYNVWYAPFELLHERRVGHVQSWTATCVSLGIELERRDENSASFGSFGTPARP
ncbi:MAG: DUF1326 domain-containing protein [Planctomycetes bacterium]|nr:DUF1326 domain-containing protein [Planctomycetota bacterium]